MHWDYEIKEINGKRYFYIGGIELNYANPHGYQIIKETEHFVLCRRRGYRGWLSLAQQTYYPPTYYIYRKTVDKTVDRLLGVYEKEYTRETIKQAKEHALKKLNELERSGN